MKIKTRITLALASIALALSGCATTGDYRPARPVYRSNNYLRSPYSQNPFGNGVGRGFGSGFGRGHAGRHGRHHQ